MRSRRTWHPYLWLKRLALATGAVAAFLFTFAWSANAGTFTFTDMVPVTLEGSGITLQILGGSVADGIDVQSTTLTVTVLAGESVTVRYPSPAGALTNDRGLSACNANASGNDVTVNGPLTVTFTPDAATPCAVASSGGGGGGGGSASAPPSATLVAPNGGATYDEATQQQIIWSASGSQVSGVRLSLSTDGGLTYPVVIADNEANDGAYLWTVPSTATTSARIRIDVLVVGGVVGATDASDANFTIRALPATVVPAPTINDDKELETPEPDPDEPPPPPPCIAGTRIKGPTTAAVYYCGKDAKRYVFPDQHTYFSWYADFKGVVTVTADALAKAPIGGNVTYKPGSLVKIQTDPKVYVVSKGGLLRWVPDEATAIAHFGTNWAKLVRDVPVVFFLNYLIGPPLAAI